MNARAAAFALFNSGASWLTMSRPLAPGLIASAVLPAAAA